MRFSKFETRIDPSALLADMVEDLAVTVPGIDRAGVAVMTPKRQRFEVIASVDRRASPAAAKASLKRPPLHAHAPAIPG